MSCLVLTSCREDEEPVSLVTENQKCSLSKRFNLLTVSIDGCFLRKYIPSLFAEVWSVAMYCNAKFCIPRSSCLKMSEFSHMLAFVVQTLLLNLKLFVEDTYNM